MKWLAAYCKDLKKPSISGTSFFALSRRVCTGMLPAFSCVKLDWQCLPQRCKFRATAKKQRCAKARTPNGADSYLATVLGFVP